MAQVLDYCLRCNSLKCRASLTERAIVTTCSHIFCTQCAENLGLSGPSNIDRHCPACQTSLVNRDDAVLTVLNPAEDYKTSVLSGLDPSTIMECAGRALAFWSYQATQEIFYQEYLSKGLTDKYAGLSSQLDKIIHDANAEISGLQNRLQGMKSNEEQLVKKNQELVDIYREKSKKYAQVTNLYNLLKSRAMRSQIKTAATDSVAHALEPYGRSNVNPVPAMPNATARNDITSHTNNNAHGYVPHHRPVTSLTGIPPVNSAYPNRQSPSLNQSEIERLHRHQRSGSSSSGGFNHNQQRRGSLDGYNMPPPLAGPINRAPGLGNGSFSSTPEKYTQRLNHFPAGSRAGTSQGLSSANELQHQHQHQHHNRHPHPQTAIPGPSYPQRLSLSELSADRFGHPNPGAGNTNTSYGLRNGMRIGKPME